MGFTAHRGRVKGERGKLGWGCPSDENFLFPPEAVTHLGRALPTGPPTPQKLTLQPLGPRHPRPWPGQKLDRGAPVDQATQPPLGS